MQSRQAGLLAAVLLCGSAALAHQGVGDPKVMARMDSMVRVAAATKTIGLMARGATDFDKAALQKAAAAIRDEAGSMPAMFQARATDPKSEASPKIWNNWADFSAKSAAMAAAADAVAAVGTQEALGPAFAALGATCKSCHAAYRE